MFHSNLYLNCIDNGTTFNKKNYLLRAAKRLGFTNILDGEHVDGIMDYVLNIEPFAFKQGRIWTGMWVIDTLCGNSTFTDNIFKIDTVFIAGTTQRNLGIYYAKDKEVVLFQACDPELHKLTGEIPQYDYLLCGTNAGDKYEERARCLNILSPLFNGRDFGKHHPPEKYVEIYNKAKVQFICSMIVRSQGEVAQRFFECLAIGPVLTNYVPDLEYLGLIEGEDYLAYRSDVDMIAKMKSLVENEDYRNTIARNGRRKAVLWHTYEQRLIGILNLIEDFERTHAKV